MLTWPVSVPAHTGSPCLLTTRPASLLKVVLSRLRPAAPRLHTRILSMYGVALLLFAVLVLQEARPFPFILEGHCPEAADSPKMGREAHNDRAMVGASEHPPRGVCASWGRTDSSAGSFTQSAVENSTTSICQQRQEFHCLFI